MCVACDSYNPDPCTHDPVAFAQWMRGVNPNMDVQTHALSQILDWQLVSAWVAERPTNRNIRGCGSHPRAVAEHMEWWKQVHDSGKPSTGSVVPTM